MLLRFSLLVLGVVMMISAAMSAVMGPGSLPYQVRDLFPISLAASHSTEVFFGSVPFVIAVMMMRPRRVVYVRDFAN